MEETAALPLPVRHMSPAVGAEVGELFWPAAMAQLVAQA